MKIRNLWIGFIVMMLVCFSVLLIFGYEIYVQKPPIPSKVLTEQGEELFNELEIKDGQSVWQSIGGQQVGTVWGHGAYVAPDWSADWLHREAVFMLDAMAFAEDGLKYS